MAGELPIISIVNMKFFATAILVISASALAQVPYQRSATPPEPRRMQMGKPQGTNRLQKIVPRNKIAGPAMGQRGAGVPKRKAKRMKNGSK
jgi:hypothetical protein